MYSPFQFKIIGSSIGPDSFSEKTVFTPLINNRSPDHHIHYNVDCTKNFSAEETKILAELNLTTVDSLLMSESVSHRSKKKCLDCFKFVKENYEITNQESMRGQVLIEINDWLMVIRVFSDRSIKFIRSFGKKSYNDFSLITLH